MRAWAGGAVAELKNQGVTFHTMSEEDRAEWMQMIPDYPAECAEEIEAQGLPGFEAAHRWVELNKESWYEWPREWAVRK